MPFPRGPKRASVRRGTGAFTKLLRPGDYDVLAIWITRLENGRWYPTGERRLAEARVYPGRTSSCTLP